MKKRVLLIALTLALLIACAVFAVSAAETTTPATIDLTKFNCPCSTCGGKPYTGTWITYDDIAAGKSVINPGNGEHYYINKSLTPGQQIAVSAGEEVVYVIDNASVIIGGANESGITGRAMLVNGKGAVMHLIGNNATYTVKSASTNNGIVQVSTSGELHLYGSLTMDRRSVGTNASANGGLIKTASGKVHIHDCDGMNLPTNNDPVLNAPALANTTASLGGVINLEGKSDSFTMDAGTLNGTSVAYAGGAISAPLGTVTINGGTVNGGTGDMTYGGAIYVNGGTVNINGGTINGGTVSTSKGYGGAIYVAAGTVNMGNATVTGGTAWRGGCISVAGSGTFNMNGGTLSGGKSTNQGAIGFISGTFNMTAGTATANTASTSNARGFRVQGGKMNLSGTAKIVSANKSTGDGIDLLRTGDDTATGVLTLAGKAAVVGPKGELTNNIRVQNYSQKSSKLVITEGWEGTTSVWYEYLFGTTYKTADYSVGMVIDSAYAASTGDYTGTLLMETAANNPPVFAGANGTLQVAQVQLCTYNLPKLDAQWFKSGTEAAAAAKPGDYIGIYAPGTMDIGSKDVTVDFNGNDCVVTGTGKLTMMDAAGDDFAGELAKVTYDNVAVTGINPANDRQYVALPNGDGTYSAHRVGLHFSAVSVRPSSAGIYYTAELNCDDTLSAAFKAAGIAVSIDAIPGIDYQEKALYTRTEELREGGFTSVLIDRILEEGADNASRGQQTIYGNAYAEFTVGEQTVTVWADPCNAGKSKGDFEAGHHYTAYSLKDVMYAIDMRWRTLSEKDQTAVKEQLYNNYDNVMHNWGLQYMIGQVKNLKVLVIGHSLSVDAGHMLGYIAQSEGMENIHFSTLYYGGCTLQQHVRFLTENTPEYRWYDTDVTDLQNKTAADTVPKVSMKKADQVTMYEGIIKDDWDIIVMQHGLFESTRPETYDKDLQTLVDYVRKHCTNPNAVLIWNMIWAGPVADDMVDKSNNGIAPDSSGYEKSYEATTGYAEMRNNKDAQDKLFEMIRAAVQDQIVGNDNFTAIIPAATAQQNALWSGLTDADMYRDYIHASDLSRYIYSYVWYCTLTDSEFDGVASDVVPLAVRYIKKDDISEIPPATEDLDLTGDDNYLLNIVNHCISSALENPFTPKGIND